MANDLERLGHSLKSALQPSANITHRLHDALARLLITDKNTPRKSWRNRQLKQLRDCTLSKKLPFSNGTGDCYAPVQMYGPVPFTGELGFQLAFDFAGCHRLKPFGKT